MTRDNPHVPRPREDELLNGDLAVVGNRQLSNDGVTVPAESRPLYELLLDILWDEHVRDTMPARLAVACDDLVEVREAVMDIDRGSAEVGGWSYGLSYCHRVRDAIDAHRDREPRRFVAVGCSGSKYEDDNPLPARERYKGSYWSGKRRYGEAVAEPPTVNADRVRWRIISAEHAVLHPDTEIDYYECTPEDLRGVPIDSDQQLPNGDSVTTLLDRWALDVYEQLTEWIRREAGSVDPRDVQLEVLLGRDYRDPLEARGVFDALRGPGAVTVSFPFQDEPDELDSGTRLMDEGGESRWEKHHRKRVKQLGGDEMWGLSFLRDALDDLETAVEAFDDGSKGERLTEKLVATTQKIIRVVDARGGDDDAE